MQDLFCSLTGRQFSIAPGEKDLLARFDLPLPRTSPFERWLRMLSGSMPFNFSRIPCPVTGKQILTRWTERGAIRGADPDWFWSDECDNTIAGRDYDFSRPFFEQYMELARSCFAPSINRINCENSPYCNACVGLKDCHLCFGSEGLVDCLFCVLCSQSTDLLMCTGCRESELSYACIDCSSIYDCRHCQDCHGCSNNFWCIDCIGCTNCLLCTGLRQAQDGHYIRNVKVSKLEWNTALIELHLGSYAAELRANSELENLAKGFIHETSRGNEDCTAVRHVTHSKNCNFLIHSSDCRDCKDLVFANHVNDSYSSSWLNYSECCYMIVGGFQAHNSFFCDGIVGSAINHRYSCCGFNGCKDIFGCFFIKAKEHCILNKQYSKKEYFELLPRVIAHMKSTGEWGQWFPAEFYGVGYRDSWAYFLLGDLSDSEIAIRGFLPSSGDEARRITSGIELPDQLDDFVPALCDKEIRCDATSRPFGISQPELAIFKKHNAPIPRRHWEVKLGEMQRKSIKALY